MNILKNALNHIQALIQNQKIVIINEVITNNNGVLNFLNNNIIPITLK